MSLEQLRQKRCKRLNIKGSSAYASRARILLIFDRGTRKHFGDLALWGSYLQYTRDIKATRKFQTVLTAALRLHPTNPDLWLYAAKWAWEAEADMNSARSYMQRGTRFCIGSMKLWIEYAKLEMLYLTKISARRRILGLGGNNAIDPSQGPDDTDREGEDDQKDLGFTTSEDIITIPDFKEPINMPSTVDTVSVGAAAAVDLMTTPMMNGAIPLAIFDAARKLPSYNAVAAEDFFNMFTAFSQVACQPRILQHVVDSMVEAFPTDASTCSCFIRQPMIGVDPMTADFPAALSSSLERLRASKEKIGDKAQLFKKTAAWMEPFLTLEGLDPDILKVLTYTFRKLQ